MRPADRHDETKRQQKPAFPTIEAPTAEAWVEGVRAFLSGRDNATDLLDALTARRLYAWKGLLDLSARGRLLCCGSGFGTVAESLVPHWDQIYLLETDHVRLRFVRQRLAISDIDSDVVFVAGQADGRLPFAPDSFDTLIIADPEVFNGSRMYSEARRVLRRGGQIFIVADNRFNLSLPTGWWDRWSTAAPPLPTLARVTGLIGRWWARRAGKFSVSSLCGSVERAGFGALRLYGLWPDRDRLNEIISYRGGPPSEPASVPSKWRKNLKRHRLFVPSHGLLAQSGGDSRRSTFGRILEQVSSRLSGPDEALDVCVERTLVTRKEKIVMLARRGEDRFVVRIPLNSAAAAAETNNAAILEKLATPPRHFAPTVRDEGTIDQLVYRVESMMPGVPLNQTLQAMGLRSALGRVETLLEQLHPSQDSRRVTFEGACYESLVEARLERLFPLIPDRLARKQVRETLRSRLYGADLPIGLVHGDFSCSNIYLYGDGQAGIIDWESAAFDDLPILDAIGLLESVQRAHHDSHSLSINMSMLASGTFRSPDEEQFLSRQYERLGIDPVHHMGLVYLRWLRQVDYLMNYWLRYHPGGHKRYIHDVIQRMPK